LWLQKFTTTRLLRSFSTYQPVEMWGKQIAAGGRDCEGRWRHIAEIISSSSASSMLDLGCAEGYFILKAAQQGCVALGVDGDLRRLTVANDVALLQEIQGAGFVYAQITPEFVRKLPQFDVVICLSLLHHIMGIYGIDHARELMQAIKTRTRLKLVFDMGQSSENHLDFSKRLPPMEPDPETWIAGLLTGCGFSSVNVLGESRGFQGVSQRSLFVAEV
jgi:SAM-dependent methyltransferase